MLRSLLPAALRGQQRCAREDQAPHHILTPESGPCATDVCKRKAGPKLSEETAALAPGMSFLGQYDRL